MLVILHPVGNFTHNVYQILHIVCDLRCFVARLFLSKIHVLLSVKFAGQCDCERVKKGQI